MLTFQELGVFAILFGLFDTLDIISLCTRPIQLLPLNRSLILVILTPIMVLTFKFVHELVDQVDVLVFTFDQLFSEKPGFAFIFQDYGDALGDILLVEYVFADWVVQCVILGDNILTLQSENIKRTLPLQSLKNGMNCYMTMLDENTTKILLRARCQQGFLVF